MCVCVRTRACTRARMCTPLNLATLAQTPSVPLTAECSLPPRALGALSPLPAVFFPDSAWPVPPRPWMALPLEAFPDHQSKEGSPLFCLSILFLAHDLELHI